MRFQTLFEGRWIFAIIVAVAALAESRRWHWLTFVCGLLIGFCLNFFRDPDRTASADPRAIIAAADGTIADIVEIEEDEFLHQRMMRVGIFLSVFDVHVNRAPIAGSVIYTQYHLGAFHDARHAKATTENEAQTWAFKGERATLVVRQITGAIARRIVAWSKVGDMLEKGERFGMIRFGSRTEIYVPLDCEITVRIGEKVKGGETTIALFPAA